MKQKAEVGKTKLQPKALPSLDEMEIDTLMMWGQSCRSQAEGRRREVRVAFRRSQCSRCEHGSVDVTGCLIVCKAFPNGVPEDIYRGRQDHRQPYPSDNGIRFEAKQTTCGTQTKRKPKEVSPLEAARRVKEAFGKSQCSRCRHGAIAPTGREMVCPAFPDGVPSNIIKGRRDHRKPYRGDGGIRFERRK